MSISNCVVYDVLVTTLSLLFLVIQSIVNFPVRLQVLQVGSYTGVGFVCLCGARARFRFSCFCFVFVFSQEGLTRLLGDPSGDRDVGRCLHLIFTPFQVIAVLGSLGEHIHH